MILSGMTGGAEIVTGSYIGDNTFPREITLGFSPKVLFVMRADGMTTSAGYTNHCLVFPGSGVSSGSEGYGPYCTLTETGFTLSNNDNRGGGLNSNGIKYVYLALK